MPARRELDPEPNDGQQGGDQGGDGRPEPRIAREDVEEEEAPDQGRGDTEDLVRQQGAHDEEGNPSDESDDPARGEAQGNDVGGVAQGKADPEGEKHQAYDTAEDETQQQPQRRPLRREILGCELSAESGADDTHGQEGDHFGQGPPSEDQHQRDAQQSEEQHGRWDVCLYRRQRVREWDQLFLTCLRLCRSLL